MPRPLIGVDLDGVIAIEDYDAYVKAKVDGVSALRNYYRTLKPNYKFIEHLEKNKYRYRYVIITARKDDLEDIKDITIQWLIDNNIETLFWSIIFTGNSWKWPWLISQHIWTLIDNDFNNLTWCPFINRIHYNSFYRNRWFDKFNLFTKFEPVIKFEHPELVFDFILWYIK